MTFFLGFGDGVLRPSGECPVRARFVGVFPDGVYWSERRDTTPHKMLGPVADRWMPRARWVGLPTAQGWCMGELGLLPEADLPGAVLEIEDAHGRRSHSAVSDLTEARVALLRGSTVKRWRMILNNHVPRKRAADWAELADLPCRTEKDAPHGFDRSSSHAMGRYVCECELWSGPGEAGVR